MAGLVLSVLVVDGLGVVASCVGRHGGQDDQRVVQGDGAARTAHTCISLAPLLKLCPAFSLTPPPPRPPLPVQLQVGSNELKSNQEPTT